MAKKAKKKAAKKQTLHEIYLAGLGAIASVGEGGAKLAHEAIEQGKKLAEVGKKKGKKRVRAAEANVEAFTGWVDDRVQTVLERIGVPSRGEVEALNERLEALLEKVSNFEAEPASSVTIFEVRKQADGWHVARTGTKKPLAVERTKKSAMDRARAAAKAAQPSRIVAFRTDGTEQARYGYGVD